MQHQLALVVDFGGQYTQLIVRRLRELGVYSEMVPWMKAEERIREAGPAAVVLSGGPRSVREENAPSIDLSVLDGIPALGICYGLQLMAHQLGGKVARSEEREYGRRSLGKTQPGSLASALDNPQVWMSHGDQVLEAPPGWEVTASTETCPVASFESPGERRWGVQFHPEVSHTPDGMKLLERFVQLSGLNRDWTTGSFIAETVEALAAEADGRRVLCGVSGGVDSSVAAALLAKAIGPRLTCVFVDHGLMRKDEAAQVIRMFSEHIPATFVPILEADRFFAALAGVTDPERKRKIIGEQFVVCFEEHAKDLAGCDFLAQGTLYPDVIESGSPTAAKIKTHHNVGGLPDWMNLKVIEPLKWLFKDEVRQVGRELGLPAEMVEREPFPGPGLAVRILGEVTRERVRIVQEADAIFRDEIRAWGLKPGIWQSYAALLDVRSVGVMGDERTYEQPIVLRAVQSEDAMTASAYPFQFEFLEHVAHRIVNEVSGVNRVLYDLTSKPPATIEWE